MPNALANEKSPYLLQHASNPVEWMPWGEPAFAKARAEDKPIFLSIGYSTCHWCHVMAHESFESAETAKILNANFVPIKVDREERPDVDRVYMTYVQMATGHGGWPLSAWLTPDLKPIYGGTYFPPTDHQNRPGFPRILEALARGWATDRARLLSQANRVTEMMKEHASPGAGSQEPGTRQPAEALAEEGGDAFMRCLEHFQQSFDAEHGGFGGAPKFPRASNINFLMCAAGGRHDQPDIAETAIQMSAHTLTMMARGGIHDHVGGGYHRYSVDGEWFVPHFEKMLYDQAQIAVNAIDVFRATGEERFAAIARDIFEYVSRDLTSPDGAFYSAEDADSEGAEGAFYIWTKQEIAAVLGADADLVCAHFDVLENGNVPAHADPSGEFKGRNILVQRQPEPASPRIAAALAKLREVRAKRPRPQRDDKIITAWNGMMISALSLAHAVIDSDTVAAVADRGTFLAVATRAAEFIHRELYDAKTGILYRSYREGRSSVQGFSEDYASLIQGLLDLYEASLEIRWLRWAVRLQETMDRLFWDEAAGGYFSSAAGDPSIVVRMKDEYDGAEPAANSVAAMNLLRVGAVLDDADANYREHGERTVAALRSRWSGTPHALPQMLCALELVLGAPRHVVLVGSKQDAGLWQLAAELRRGLGPRRAVIGLTDDDDRDWWAERAPWTTTMKKLDGLPTAYVCENFTCQAPVNTPAALRTLLVG